MEFFDKLGKKASQTYQYTADKTSKLAKEAKLKMTITNYKDKIEDLYQEIGKKVYEKHVREEDIQIEDNLQEACKQIDELASQIEISRKEILALKNRKQCPNCDYEIEIRYHYCPNCGAKQEEEPEIQTVSEEKTDIAKENIAQEEPKQPVKETSYNTNPAPEDYNNIHTIIEDETIVDNENTRIPVDEDIDVYEDTSIIEITEKEEKDWEEEDKK